MTSTTSDGDTPSSAAITDAFTLLPDDSHSADTAADTVVLQLFVPPHTPQLSITAPTQHTPDGGNALLQHRPVTSTDTLLPPHTPHTSTTPAQHRPDPSTTPPAPQHTPVTTSITPTQHSPLLSTTPPLHGTAADPLPPDDTISGTVHVAPPQPSRHTHCDDTHALLAPLQSVSTAHPQVESVDDGVTTHDFHDVGRIVTGTIVSPVTAPPLPVAVLAHMPSSTTLPFEATHVTLRVAFPNTRSLAHRDVASLVSGAQLLHDDVDHTYTADGHGIALHVLDVVGRARPDDTHAESSTADATTSLPASCDAMHTGGDTMVVTPGGWPSTRHGAEHGVQCVSVTQYSVGH